MCQVDLVRVDLMAIDLVEGSQSGVLEGCSLMQKRFGVLRPHMVISEHVYMQCILYWGEGGMMRVLFCIQCTMHYSYSSATFIYCNTIMVEQNKSVHSPVHVVYTLMYLVCVTFIESSISQR